MNFSTMEVNHFIAILNATLLKVSLLFLRGGIPHKEHKRAKILNSIENLFYTKLKGKSLCFNHLLVHLKIKITLNLCYYFQ